MESTETARALACGASNRVASQDVPTEPSAPSVHSKGKWQGKAAWNPDNARPSGADSGAAAAGAAGF